MKPNIIEQLWYHDIFFYSTDQQPDASHQKIRKKKKEEEVLVMEYVTPFHCSCIYNLSVRESVPRQVDKKSRGPQGDRGLEFSRRKKGQIFFSLYIP